MNQKLLWTVVTVLSTFVGTTSISRAQTATSASITSQKMPSQNVVEVNTKGPNALFTKVYAHKLSDRQAATLYVRNIPVFTFLSSTPATASDNQNSSTETILVNSDYNNPVEKANLLAAKINDLIDRKVDASKITVSWNGSAQSKSGAKSIAERYMIKVDGSELVEINSDTILPDASQNSRQDALQATNRLRRLVSKASPLSTIDGLPPELTAVQTKPEKQTTATTTASNKNRKKVANRRGGRSYRGMASFYGYDGSGNKTASGERFNPEKMTAAHRSLPFGTRVRVTNVNNGRSVVVRINDRGPFIRGRIIDLSHGAARVIQMIGRGVAPVKVEVLGR
ncbi:MAG: septal ring lytic transglycosylase RlpA family protein [Richelia sp. RM2_1_2]|nr:septal ring lytic transglycosylase RlpA family protein [Richelia sp. SM2_1_7]NJM20243.1 septal ring lytic transglycosylase RlpA family protein [Richelia sp. SM1_7_0]NJN08075.1 septal ring lytic transglycosylase RlpA family protein [Richelia sp. RM1_1_1]NJO29598.1 septal ring lytic transglycosylase RlpA family protein [Richelia sp. SL_2_1]NJO58253.1 septal ring lytic transglycosylase RlpA family protein [Richelia sp. RM2_1_2]